MNKADKMKLFYIFGVSLIFFLSGCIDTNVTNVPSSVDFHSQVKLVNVASDVGNASITLGQVTGGTLNAQLTGSLALGAELPASGAPYADISSGAKTMIVKYDNVAVPDTFKFTLDSQTKMRIFIIGNSNAGSRNTVRLIERYTFQAKNTSDGSTLFPPDTASIQFYNATADSSDAMITLASSDNSVKLDTAYNDLAFGGQFHYLKVKATGNSYKISTVAGSDTVSTTFTPAAKDRYTGVLYGRAGGYVLKILTDD